MNDHSNLAVGPIPAHLRRIAVPYAVGMVFVILFSLVDTWFAGLLSTEALAALAISFPIFFILTAIGMGINAAVTALVGNALGAGDGAYAKRLSSQGLSYAVAASMVLAVIGFFTAPLLVGAVSGETAVHGLTVEYLNVLFLTMPAFFVFFCANGILLAQGDSLTVMYAHIANLAANIVLTPPMVFGIPGGRVGGIGFTGIALSTLISQTGVMLYVVRAVTRSEVWLNDAAATYRPRADDFGALTAQALPTGIALALILFSGYIVQLFLRDFGAGTIAAFGTAIRIEQLLLLPGIALAYSLRPIVSQNFGAAEYARVRAALVCCCRYGTVLMVGAAVILAAGGRVAMGWFTADPEVLRVGGHVLLVLAVLMPFTFLVLAVNSFLQGLKQSAWVLAIILYERLFGLVGFSAVCVMALGMGIWGVWSGVAASGITGCLLALGVAARVVRRELGRSYGSA